MRKKKQRNLFKDIKKITYYRKGSKTTNAQEKPIRTIISKVSKINRNSILIKTILKVEKSPKVGLLSRTNKGYFNV